MKKTMILTAMILLIAGAAFANGAADTGMASAYPSRDITTVVVWGAGGGTDGGGVVVVVVGICAILVFCDGCC